MHISGSPASSVLTTHALSAGYGNLVVVRDADVYVAPSECVAIVGPNGAGKSTFLKAVLGITTVISGDIRVNGRTVAGHRPDEVVNLGVGYVPQAGLVFPNLSVAENLEMGAYVVARRARARRIQEVLTLFPHLQSLRHRHAASLSGGEQTMLGIARAMLPEPTLLLLDEISSGLAPRVIESLWSDLRALREQGVAMLMVEQRTKEVLELADRGYVFVSGTPVLDGPSDYLLNEVDLAAVFLQSTGPALKA